MTYKWSLYDGTTTMNFAYNPDGMSSPYRPKEIQVSTAQLQTIMNPKKATDWSFSGNVYSNAEYTKLVTWHNKDLVLQLTDHLGRVWDVVSQSLDITDRRPSGSNSQRYKYTWKMLNLGLHDGSL